MTKKNYFGNIKKGALTKYINKKYGKSAYTDKGTIKVSVLDDIIKNGDLHRKRQAQFAKNARKFKHHRK